MGSWFLWKLKIYSIRAPFWMNFTSFASKFGHSANFWSQAHMNGNVHCVRIFHTTDLSLIILK